MIVVHSVNVSNVNVMIVRIIVTLRLVFVPLVAMVLAVNFVKNAHPILWNQNVVNVKLVFMVLI